MNAIDIYYYAPSTAGFYLSSFHGDDIPADALEITRKLHGDLLKGQADGLRIYAPDEEHALPWLGEPVPQEEAAADHMARITARLKAIDAESARPMRAIVGGWAIDEDKAALAVLENEAEELRKELKTLRGEDGQEDMAGE